MLFTCSNLQTFKSQQEQSNTELRGHFQELNVNLSQTKEEYMGTLNTSFDSLSKKLEALGIRHGKLELNAEAII